MVGASRKILIRGLEPGSAYLAYLLAKSGDRVWIQTTGPNDVYLYDLPPPGLFMKQRFLRDLLLVEFVESADPNEFDLVIDSCDVDQESLLRLYEEKDVIYVEEDPWLSATLSLSRGLPAPDPVDLPVEKTSNFRRVEVKISEYRGAPYTLCNAVDDESGRPYKPLRTLERIYLAADLFKDIKGLGPRPRAIKLEYAVGRDVFFLAMGVEKRGKISRISVGGFTAWVYGEGGNMKYVLIKGDRNRFGDALRMYNGLRLDRYFYLYDLGPGRGALNIASLGHLTRHERRHMATRQRGQEKI